ncbi:glycosyltransferase [Paraburkholderia sp. MMS20-SJTN17]|uniref:Glycosyltransferase n=1 Tax=Paraburkholderia translucens TaxID=2886945 RepID=A0ABS8K951_9BURK|nr:glycosyltransferase [Paraburkholderia sp. MMS20-SJTN17]MCC8401283.1 glycosyltransferase [Paraburkholderia sp. MMS20-SJTN17]
MFVIIAPYSVKHGSDFGNPAAKTKMGFFLSLLARLEKKIVLVNTLHAKQVWQKREEYTCRIGDASVREIVLRQYPVRPIGKLLNLFEVDAVAKEIAQAGEPTLIWAYNGYAFEAMLARALKRRFNAPFVFEYEDAAMARRKWHPKTWVDFLAWRYLLPEPDLCLAVNRSLLKRERRRSGCDAQLCPGVVSAGLIEACTKRPAFSEERRQQVVVGYFGTLHPEKGADWLPEMVERLGDNFVFHVSGRGPLAEQFEALSARRPNFFFHGYVDQDTVYELMADCDVLLNPHQSIEALGGGLFPFKVIEYVATGRLVVSTALPDANLAVAFKSIVFVEHDIASFVAVLNVARQVYEQRRARIDIAVADVRRRFGEQGLLRTLSDVLVASREVEADQIDAGVLELIEAQRKAELLQKQPLNPKNANRTNVEVVASR